MCCCLGVFAVEGVLGGGQCGPWHRVDGQGLQLFQLLLCFNLVYCLGYTVAVVAAAATHADAPAAFVSCCSHAEELEADVKSECGKLGVIEKVRG